MQMCVAEMENVRKRPRLRKIKVKVLPRSADCWAPIFVLCDELAASKKLKMFAASCALKLRSDLNLENFNFEISSQFLCESFQRILYRVMQKMANSHQFTILKLGTAKASVFQALFGVYLIAITIRNQFRLEFSFVIVNGGKCFASKCYDQKWNE